MHSFTIPTTGLIYLFGTFIYLYLSRRFYQCYKEENNRTAKFFSYSFFLVGMNYLVTAIPTLFLIDSQSVWRFISPLYVFFISAGWFVLGYVVFSQKLPRYSKTIAIIFSYLVLVSIVPFIFYTPTYFYTDGVLDWDFQMNFESLFLFLVPYIISPIFLVLLIIIFFLQAKRASEKKVRIRSFGFALSLSFIIIGMLIDATLLNSANVHPLYSDLNYLIMFTTLAITLIFTWFPSKSKYVAKIE